MLRPVPADEIRNGFRQTKIPENLAVEFVPVFGNGVEELPCPARPFLYDAGRHIQIRPARGIFQHKGQHAVQKTPPRPAFHGGIKNPQPIAPGVDESGFSQNLQMPRHPRLSHGQQRDQLVDGKLITLKHQRQTQARFIGKSFQIAESGGHNITCHASISRLIDTDNSLCPVRQA